MTDPTPHDPTAGGPAGQDWAAAQHGGRPPTNGMGPSNGMGLAAMIVGIVGLVLAVVFFPLGILLGIIAVVLGVVGRKRVGRREATNGGQATAGIVTGALAIVVGGLIAAFVGNFLADNAEEIGDLTDCLEEAGGDAAAEEACQEQFEDEVVSAPAWSVTR